MIVQMMRVAAESSDVAVPDEKAVGRIIGLSLERAISELFPKYGDDIRAGILDAYRTEALRMRADPQDPEKLFGGVLDVVHALRDEGHILGIATGKARRGVSHFCSRYDLDGWFDTIQTPDTNPSKPHPAMIESALSETGAAAERTVMIGDTTFDIEMARNAGVFSIGVAWGNHPVDELERAGAHHIVEKVEDLPQVITEIMGKG